MQYSPSTAASVAAHLVTLLDNGSTLEVLAADATTVLASVTLASPPATSANNVITFQGLPLQDPSIDANGTAAFVAIKNSAGTLRFRGTLTQNGGGGDYELASDQVAALNLVQGNALQLTSITMTVPQIA